MLVNRRVARIGSVAVVWFVAVTITAAAELKPKTIAAFDHYVGLTEARIQSEVSGEQPFLWVDRSSPDDRTQLYDRLNRGEVLVERLETREGDRKISIPSGLVHHWIGSTTVLIPGVSLESTIALVRDFERYAATHVCRIATGEIEETYEPTQTDSGNTVASRRASKAGKARSAALTPERRSEIAARAAKARWTP